MFNNHLPGSPFCRKIPARIHQTKPMPKGLPHEFLPCVSPSLSAIHWVMYPSVTFLQIPSSSAAVSGKGSQQSELQFHTEARSMPIL